MDCKYCTQSIGKYDKSHIVCRPDGKTKHNYFENQTHYTRDGNWGFSWIVGHTESGP